MDQGGNYWTLFTPGIWKVLHAVLHIGLIKAEELPMAQRRQHPAFDLLDAQLNGSFGISRQLQAL